MIKYTDINYYDYKLDKSFIAQTPIKNRDESKLLVLDRIDGSINHYLFKDILKFLHKGDVLVLNDTKVIPARLFGVKENTCAHIEILLLKELDDNNWETIIRNSRRLNINDVILFGDGRLKAKVIKKLDEGVIILQLIFDGILYEILNQLGEMPLPPYIHEHLSEQDRYQTVYAKNLGSAAAPTAGLHFTKDLLAKLENKGIIIRYVTLHVGLGTFRPVSEDDITKHEMHSEYYIMSKSVADTLNNAKDHGNKIIAVGTTTCRVLETIFSLYGKFEESSGETNIFIYPGYQFKAIDSLITNFHLPKSTLMMLVSALAGRDNIMSAYEEAKNNNYRFFSFGDAMFIDMKKRKQDTWLQIIKDVTKEKPYLKEIDFKIISGTNNVLLSAPHAHKHNRNGSEKSNEYNTGNLIKLLHRYTNCHIMYTYKNTVSDPNMSTNKYKDALEKYIKDQNIEYLIDIHGIKDIYDNSIEIGTNSYQNINNDEELIKHLIDSFHKNNIKKIAIDQKFKSSTNTVTNYINKLCNIKTIQIEISCSYRKLLNKPLKFTKVLSSLEEFINNIKEK